MRLVATSPTLRGTARLEIALIGALLAGCGGSPGVPAPAPPAGALGERTTGARKYATRFPLTEDPISEGGRWINGGASGLDWTDVQTTPGMAFGTMPGDAGYPQEYADSTAVLRGAWGAGQMVWAKLRVPNPSRASGVYEEVELRLRTTIAAHSITGYEINCSVNTSDPYMQVVKWNGPLADFTLLDGRATGCADGDVLKAAVTGAASSAITVYKDGARMFSVTDDSGPFTSGSPGIGFFLEGATGLNADYGFSRFRTRAMR
ncbi:MAG TPA: hypothetical protein VN909_07985 [Candidatus Dormibacteraeota bacterium]|nr:hypothetical protein [Candidatus Dormibacteraeota bacterium]